MKYLLVLLMLAFPLVCVADTLWDVKEYAKENGVSCYKSAGYCTAVYCPEYINAEGEIVYPNCNTCTTEYECSDSKVFTVRDSGEGEDPSKSYIIIDGPNVIALGRED